MKKLILASMMLLTVAAHAEDTRVVMSKTTHKLYVEVSPLTVKLSSAGYGEDLVKILIPALAEITFLNHRNEGENAPCLATWTTKNVADIHKNQTEVQELDVEIELDKVLTPDAAAGVCHVNLEERINTIISGEVFNHLRYQQLPDRVLADCQ